MPVPRLGRGRKKLHLFDLRAQRFDKLLECLLRIGVSPLPMRRLDEREHRLEGWLFTRNPDEGNAGAGPRIGVELVVALQLLEQQREVIEISGKKTDMVERPRKREDAGARD